MCLESLVAIMAIVAACTMDPGVYLAMNVKGEAAATAAKVTALGFPVTVEHMDELAKDVGEHTLFGRTGGAATLAVGMAQIFSKVVGHRWLDLWYHFAIMFEALFILTTLDAGTRVGRYILQDFLGNLWKPLGDTKAVGPNLLASGLMVGGWGVFLIQGVRDPLGGINSLWPLFGIANQMLATIALCLATTILLKMALKEGAKIRPVLALITLVPLVWLLSVTFTAGIQKVWHSDSRIGFLSKASEIREKLLPPAEIVLRETYAKAASEIIPSPELKAALDKAQAAAVGLRSQLFNNRLDAGVAISFLLMVSIILGMSVWEWIGLLAGRKPAVLKESEPVWLPDYAVVEGGRMRGGGAAGAATLALALAKELSGESHLERARQQATVCDCAQHPQSAQAAAHIYVQATEQRFTGVRRCC